MEDNEIWKDVVGYESLYQISNKGRLKHKPTKAIGGKGYCDKPEYFKQPYLNRNGYYHCALSANDKTKDFLIHRLVAMAFLPNPKSFRVVNHINGIKTDNRVENLEWCTHSENTRHAFRIGTMGNYKESDRISKPVRLCKISDGTIFDFGTIKSAAIFLELSPETIKWAISHNLNKKGYSLQYI